MIKEINYNSDPKPDPKPEIKSETKSEIKLDPKPEIKSETKSEIKLDPKPETKSDPIADILKQANTKIDTEINKIDPFIDSFIDNIELKDLIILILIIIVVSLISYFVYHKFFIIEIDDTLFENMATYYINLDRSKDRRQNIESMCREHGINVERFSAIDGKLLNLEDPKYAKALKKIKWWFLIENRKNVGHFGCYLSHMQIYEKFLQTDKQYCFILEDDSEFITSNLKEGIMGNMRNLPRDWDILLLGYEINGGNKGYKEVREGNKDTKLVNGLLNIKYFTGTHAYILTRNCIKKLIENLQVMDWIIDWNIAYLARRGLLNIYGAFPPLVCQPAVHMIQINDIDYTYNCQIRFDTLTNK